MVTDRSVIFRKYLLPDIHIQNSLLGIADEQLWCFNQRELRNEKNDWKSDHEWSMPEAGKHGIVKDISANKVIEVSEAGIVSMENEKQKERQQWIRSADVEMNYFRLTNSFGDFAYLTATDATTLTVALLDEGRLDYSFTVNTSINFKLALLKKSRITTQISEYSQNEVIWVVLKWV